MEVLDRGEALRKTLDDMRSSRRTPGLRGPNAATGLRGPNAATGLRGPNAGVGLVPTMGSLHEGHASLIRRAAAECELVAVTIFVNPLQFGDPADLAAYPRDLDHDIAVAAEAGAELVFAPPVEDMYPGGRPAVTVSVAGFDDLEGASRPGHFDGVATVVAKLWNLAGPCRAYFGEKDWQQLAVVRRLVEDLSFPIEVVACPTVREPDGLACSSRNARLSPRERTAATVLYRALTTAALAISAGECDRSVVRRLMGSIVAKEPLAALDYAEWQRDRLLIAARVGGVRLIDNLGVAT